jgi:uncharacterized protein (TIGR02246 family)
MLAPLTGDSVGSVSPEDRGEEAMAFSGPPDDRLAIRELIDAYADATMLRDEHAWAALWDDDARWHLPDFPDYGDTVGKEAIVAMWTRAVADHPALVYVATPGAIEVDGDRAAVRLYTSEVYTDAESGATIRRRGRYDDTLVKRDGRWYIADHTFRMLHEE